MSSPGPLSGGSLYLVFEGERCIARGSLNEAAEAVRAALPKGGGEALLVFDGSSGEVVDLDLRGGTAIVAQGEPAPAPVPMRGRPKLGVVAREVTLLPQHWAWLNAQPGGASAVLRRLVDQARRSPAARRRAARDATYRFILALAGDLPGFEEASRALFAGDAAGFERRIAAWPPDIRAQAMAMLRRGEEI